MNSKNPVDASDKFLSRPTVKVAVVSLSMSGSILIGAAYFVWEVTAGIDNNTTSIQTHKEEPTHSGAMNKIEFQKEFDEVEGKITKLNKQVDENGSLFESKIEEIKKDTTDLKIKSGRIEAILERVERSVNP